MTNVFLWLVFIQSLTIFSQRLLSFVDNHIHVLDNLFCDRLIDKEFYMDRVLCFFYQTHPHTQSANQDKR